MLPLCWADMPDKIVVPGLKENFSGAIFDYKEFIMNVITAKIPRFKTFLTTMPSWDNTPRTKLHQIQISLGRSQTRLH